MRIRIKEAIKRFNETHDEKLTQRKLAKIAMPDTEITASQMYLKKIDSGRFGPKTSINLYVLYRIVKYTRLDVKFLIEFENDKT